LDIDLIHNDQFKNLTNSQTRNTQQQSLKKMERLSKIEQLKSKAKAAAGGKFVEEAKEIIIDKAGSLSQPQDSDDSFIDELERAHE
jgi:hypothetical protein